MEIKCIRHIKHHNSNTSKEVVNNKLYTQTVLTNCTQDTTRDQYYILGTVSIFTQTKREVRDNSRPKTKQETAFISSELHICAYTRITAAISALIGANFK
jgi:hypothetical protein